MDLARFAPIAHTHQWNSSLGEPDCAACEQIRDWPRGDKLAAVLATLVAIARGALKVHGDCAIPECPLRIALEAVIDTAGGTP